MIKKISDDVRRAILRKSPEALPDDPAGVGMKAEDIQASFFRYITDRKFSALAELARIVEEMNTEIERWADRLSQDVIEPNENAREKIAALEEYRDVADILNLYLEDALDKAYEADCLAKGTHKMQNAKVEKMTGETEHSRLYAVDEMGNEVAVPISHEPNEGMAAAYSENGTLQTEDPTEDDDCANKEYVDESILKWKAQEQTGESLHFELCKGGYFEYGLKVVGETAQVQLTGKNLFMDFSLREPKLGRDIISYGNHTIIENIDEGAFYNAVSFHQYNVNNAVVYTINPDNSITILPRTGYLIHYGLAVAFRVLPNTSYSFFFDWNDNDGSDDNYGVARVTQLDSGGAKTGAEAILYKNSLKQCTINTTDSAVVVGIVFFVGTYSNIQFEKSSTPTSYEPYCGGIPAPNPSYPMPIQCVKQGSIISCGDSTIVTPCDLYEGDVWYPMSGKVERHNGYIASYNGEDVPTGYVSTTGGLDANATIVYPMEIPTIEQYDPQPIFAPSGTVNVLQTPTELAADLSATVLVEKAT